MKVNTIGGGPGGLYASLLLKKTYPDWDVTVHEQNLPGVTYGWGIVFPNRALSNLAEADQRSHEAITETFNQWNPFDIYYEEERYRCGGHAFASMMRTDLLEVLQKRCRELGVDLQFETEITDPGSLAAEADLCIVADGIHSNTREAHADEFGTDTVEGSMPFSWFGTEKQFDALTHIFVENEAGIWSAHTYPGRTSTFIIDCDAETWDRSGVAEMTEEEYLAYFEDVFADYLDGHPLLSQQDRWRRFQTVRNENWYHDNMVLVGDAAHTAHYSIGSGTTLAMEDGIGLVEAFENNDDIEEALEGYEAARKPVVGNLLSAAERSRIHFELIRRFYDMPARRFVLHHLTRSGRLTYGSLERRDPSFIGRFDEWFAERTPGDATVLPPAQQPLQLGETVVENRFVRALEPTMSAEEGTPSESQRATVESASAHEPGLLLTEPLAVAPSGRPTAGSQGLYAGEHRDVWTGLVADVPDTVTVGAHLVHAGPAAAGEPPVFDFGDAAAREDAWAPRLSKEFPTPPRKFHRDVMDGENRDTVVEQFCDAAGRADAVGFDYLQIHAGANTLLGHYLLTTDGHMTEGVALPRAVVKAVRTAWPNEKSMGVTLPVSDRGDDGLSPEEALSAAEVFADVGCDLVAPVDVASGEREPAQLGPSDFSDDIRNELGVQTLTTVPTMSVDKVNTLVATGRADLCVFPIPRPTSEEASDE